MEGDPRSNAQDAERRWLVKSVACVELLAPELSAEIFLVGQTGTLRYLREGHVVPNEWTHDLRQ